MPLFRENAPNKGGHHERRTAARIPKNQLRRTQEQQEQGYTLTSDEGAYIRRNSEEFYYAYSTPTPEQSGMMMQ